MKKANQEDDKTLSLSHRHILPLLHLIGFSNPISTFLRFNFLTNLRSQFPSFFYLEISPVFLEKIQSLYFFPLETPSEQT